MISRSSTSEGSNSVFSASSESCGATSCISNSWMPSSDQPCERATAVISSRVSERLTYIPVSPMPAPLEQELQSERGLPGSRIALDQVDAVGGKSPSQHVVQAGDPGRRFRIIAVSCHPRGSPRVGSWRGAS